MSCARLQSTVPNWQRGKQEDESEFQNLEHVSNKPPDATAIGKSGMQQPTGSQRVRHDLVTEQG